MPPITLDNGTEIPGGFSSMNQVHSDSPSHKDEMPSFFLAETLKYLYLIFTDPATVLPLDQWVLTTEAHPVARRKYIHHVATRTPLPPDSTAQPSNMH